MNWLDPIDKIYNMYLEEEETPQITEIMEITDEGLRVDIEDGLANPYLKLHESSQYK